MKRISIGPVARAVRRWLGIDTWGWDFLRLKRRVRALGYIADMQEQNIETLIEINDVLVKRIEQLEQFGGAGAVKLFEQRLTSLEHEVNGSAGLARQIEARQQQCGTAPHLPTCACSYCSYNRALQSEFGKRRAVRFS